MALDTPPLLRKKQDFAFALESTTGTPATLTGTNGVTPVFNPSIKYSTEIVPRQQYGSLSPRRQGLGARSAEATFETELFGGSSPYWVALLSACGINAGSGNVYTPLDNAADTITLASYINGRKRTCYGAMGTFKIIFKRGQAARIQWNFKGISLPLASASITPTYATTVAPLVGTGAFTIGGSVYYTDEVTFDLGNVVILRQDVTGQDPSGAATGYRAAYVTDRQSKITLAPEASLAEDFNAAFQSSTTIAFSIAVGTATNNTFTLAAPNLQQVKAPEDGERDGTLTDQLELLCTSTTTAGQDEWSLTQS